MKRNIFVLLAIAMSAIFVTSCAKELQIEPTNNTYTLAQVKKAYTASNYNADAAANSLYASLGLQGKFHPGSHSEFGWPSMLMKLDCLGDTYQNAGQYGHFNTAQDYSACQTDDGYITWPLWRGTYSYIANANRLIPVTEEPAILAQAYGIRAYFYFQLVRAYANSYHNPKAPGVVWVDENTVKPGARMTVEQTYEKILKDIRTSDSLFTVANLQAEASSHGYFQIGALYHLQAQVYLEMAAKGDTEATKYAPLAIDAADKCIALGYSPYTIQDCSKPNFWNYQDPNMVWAMTYSPNSRTAKDPLLTWTTWQTPICLQMISYAAVRKTPKINSNVYDLIPVTDVRRQWFGYKDTTTGKIQNLNLRNTYPKDEADYLLAARVAPYTSVKFAPSDGNLNAVVATACTPLMRIEEMYYVKAEAQARDGKITDAQATLEELVKNYRNGSYDPSIFATKEDLLAEIYQQRRVEFFGEGKSFFDAKRFKRGILRSKTRTLPPNPKSPDWGGYLPEDQFNIGPDDPILNMYIPQNEIDNNKLCKQNPIGSVPKPNTTF